MNSVGQLTVWYAHKLRTSFAQARIQRTATAPKRLTPATGQVFLPLPLSRARTSISNWRSCQVNTLMSPGLVLLRARILKVFATHVPFCILAGVPRSIGFSTSDMHSDSACRRLSRRDKHPPHITKDSRRPTPGRRRTPPCHPRVSGFRANCIHAESFRISGRFSHFQSCRPPHHSAHYTPNFTCLASNFTKHHPLCPLFDLQTRNSVSRCRIDSHGEFCLGLSLQPLHHLTFAHGVLQHQNSRPEISERPKNGTF